MKAKINIKTPAGKSLEGFPFNFDQDETAFDFYDNIITVNHVAGDRIHHKLHKGDTITIEVLWKI